VECRCTIITELYGTEAGEYVTRHLQPDGDGFVCPDTGRRWKLDDADPEQTRLAQLQAGETENSNTRGDVAPPN
jgi:hypothetical protein